MAKTVAPLLSFSAGGQIANTQVYSKWKGRPYVRRYVVPGNPNTAGQQQTRNSFSWLMNVWKFFPTGAAAAWAAYGDSLKITDRNAFAKQNVAALRTATDLSDFVMSPSARSGIIATAMQLTAGSGSINVALTAPVLPNGWTITNAWAAAIKQQNPQTGTDYQVVAGSDASDPYSIDLTGLEAGTEYVVGGWFEFTRSDGLKAYGRALQDVATPTV